MKSLRFARGLVALTVAALAVAGPAFGSSWWSSSSRSWTVAPTPNPGGWGNIVWGATALTEQDAWAVGPRATPTAT
jgi:hypothetical protein